MSKLSAKKGRFEIVGMILLIILLPIILPLLILYGVAHLLFGLFLYIAIWWRWCLRGRYILFVYSDSPIWHDYIKQQILPVLGERAVILNWSERSRWRKTLAVFAFRYFGGSREFNPMAIVFRPLRFSRKFRFFNPFQDFKHGKPETVAKMERELYNLVDSIDGVRQKVEPA